MALRLLEIILPETNEEQARKLLEEQSVMGLWQDHVSDTLLLLINAICVNLAGVGTFLVQGIRPLTWWEVDRAKKASLNALVIWMVLLSVLVCIIIFSQRN